MTDLSPIHAFGICAAFGLLGVVAVGIVAKGWEEIRKRGGCFVAVFSVFALLATATAQKPPQPPSVRGINLSEISHDARGFDVAWDYGDTEASALSGKTVKLRCYVTGMDYVLELGEFPTSTTNFHCNALQHGFPVNWMKHDWKVEARIENFLSIIYNGGDR